MTRFHVSIETMRCWLKTSTALTTAVVMGIGQPALALAQGLPTGGTVAAGSATITQPTASSLVINQTSQSAITNWQSFSIGQGNSVAVVQPSTSAAMLARVTGNTPSTIAGSLTATGQLMLVNPNGIAITPTGTVKAGSGFIATTLNTTDDDFLAGRTRLTGNGASNAVTNAGTITVGPGGYAALIGGTVANSGTISVPMGKVGLGSGEVATLDFSGDGFLQVGVPTKASGTEALVSQAGKIVATGGRVEIKAAAARDAARQAINMSGVVAARSVSGSDGNITLDGGDGQVQVSGRLTAASRTAKGGTVTITGRDIKLTNAKINASGKTGGGTIKIGGDRQGKGTLQHAQTTSIDTASVIKANATATGTGGNVVVWSDTKTDFAGRISAQGGPNGGNGGEAEVSSHGVLAYTGTTILTAPMGQTGTLLLDPYNVTISNGTDSAPLSAPSNGSTSFTASANDSVLSVATLQSALAGANVTVSTGSSGSQAGDITIAAPLSWSANLLRLDAAHSINVAATVTVGGTGGLTLNTNVGGGTGGTIDFGLTSAGFTGKIDFTGTPANQTLTINGTQYTLLASMADVANANNGLSGSYALAKNLDASGTTYTDALIGHDNTALFAGTFDGLGHTISNLTINKTSGDYAGLFGAASGTIRNIGAVGGSVSGYNHVGGLTGYSSGGLTNVYATGVVRGNSYVGGLVGYLNGPISNAYAKGAVNGTTSIGGLVGLAAGSITNVYATGTVNGSNNVGGLVGINSNLITNAYATGAVSGDTNIGGLAGNVQNGTVTNAYATGAVSGNTNVGGLLGYTATSIVKVYATGAVSGGSNVGGLVGQFDDFDSPASNSYWNTQTTGQSVAFGTDNSGFTNQVTGLTTAQLQNGTAANGLGAAFTVANGLNPYLTRFFPNGVQAISGIAYSDSGRTPYASGVNGARTVFVDIGGQQVAATTGANGYYYVQLANGTLSAANGGTPVLAYTRANGGSGAVSGAQLTTASGNLGNLDVWGSLLIAPTSATRLSNAGASVAGLLSANGGANQTLLTTAAGGDTVATNATTGVAGLTSIGYIASNAAGFTVDQTIATNGLYVKTTAGSITVSSSQTINGPNNLTLLSAGDLNINAPIQVNGNGAVNLAYSGNLNAALGSSGFTGGLTFAKADGTAATLSAGGTLTVNGNPVTLLYSMADVANANNGLAGSYALARNLDASGTTYTDALIGHDNTTPFTGTFDGLGHTVSNLTINKTSGNYAGLFGYADSATIRNIGVVGGSISGGDSVGGLVGTTRSGTVVSNAFATGAVTGTGNLGGLIGAASGTLANVYATGAVTGGNRGNYIGGLVGAMQGSIRNAYATGAVSTGTQAMFVGGLVGSPGGSLTNVYATGTVTTGSGSSYVGGLAGYIRGPSDTITNAYATGAVTGGSGSTNVGGLVGDSWGTLTNVYAMGAVSGGTNVGGLLGGSNGSLTNAYATGVVSGQSAVGGLAGLTSTFGSTSNVYWNITTSGLDAGFGQNDGNRTATGLTTAQLQDGASANGLGNGFTLLSGLYPYLTSLAPNGVRVASGFAYKDAGVTRLTSGASGNGQVFVRFGNGAVTTVTTGADGYYYAIVANDGSASPVIAYTLADQATGATNGIAVRTADASATQSLDISGGWRRDVTGSATLSALDAAYMTGTAGTSAAGLTFANRRISSQAAFNIDTALSLSGTLGLNGTSAVTQSAAISAASLILNGTGATFTLKNSGNQIGSLVAAGTSTSIDIYSAGNLTLAARAPDADNTTVSGVQTDGIRIAAGGNLTIANGAVVAGLSPVLAAGGAFTNTAGASAVIASNGRWLVYAANPTGNTYGGLDSHNAAVWNTAAGGAVTATGNRYVFANQPILTVAAGNAVKTYGDVATLPGYTISGFQTGVTGAYLGDTRAGAISGTASLTSAGTAATANAGTYAIIAAQGSLNAGGYGFTFVNGSLSVNTRPITVTADARSRIFGTANPAFTYTTGGLGLVNGDALVGTLASTATATSNVGTYAITQGTLAASDNYALTYTGATLSITPRALTVTADAQSRIFGTANPAFTYTTGGLGLVNGDALVGTLASTATATSNVGTYAITQGTLAASDNYALTYTGATLSITPRALTVTADAQSRIFGTANPAFTYTTGGLGLVNGDALVGTLASTATATSNVGTYAITQGTLAASDNYALTYTGALLTIMPVPTNPSSNGHATPGGTSNSGSATPSNPPGTTIPVVKVITPPLGLFAIVSGSTVFSPPTTQAGLGGSGFTPSGPSAAGGFTSPGYDAPSTCVAGRACGS